ncbi:MAG: hypothetical protein JNN26_16850 [Candidatus Obscuribacter sp.]|nr:hypothetical protein [Candidatus Obscuribacter sp.]
MARLASTASMVLPPFQYWNGEDPTSSVSPESRSFLNQFDETRRKLEMAVCGHEYTPQRREELSYIDSLAEKFEALRHARVTDRRYDFSEELISFVEHVWDRIKISAPVRRAPTVVPGDEVISLCWAPPGKRLEVSFYRDEDTEKFSFDWVLETKEKGKSFGDPIDYDESEVCRLVRSFSAE